MNGRRPAGTIAPMDASDLSLVLCIVLSGLWSGLLLAVTNLLHPVFRALDPPDFAAALQRFLPVARRAPANWVVVIGLLVAPAVALATVPAGSGAFVLIAVGLAFCIAGPLVVSNRLAEPNYDVIAHWDPADMPADWHAARRRYFLFNWVRAAATWTAFALFVAAAFCSWTS